MLITSSGKITDDFYVLGDPGVPVYFMDGDEPSLFDAGFTALAQLYEGHIREILGSRTPSYLLNTRARVTHIRDRMQKAGISRSAPEHRGA